jgi:hypothetical protein
LEGRHLLTGTRPASHAANSAARKERSSARLLGVTGTRSDGARRTFDGELRGTDASASAISVFTILFIPRIKFAKKFHLFGADNEA